MRLRPSQGDLGTSAPSMTGQRHTLGDYLFIESIPLIEDSYNCLSIAKLPSLLFLNRDRLRHNPLVVDDLAFDATLSFFYLALVVRSGFRKPLYWRVVTGTSRISTRTW